MFLAGWECHQGAEALALNWLLAGSDAHAKNYSLLLSGPQVRLAPLYDVASALPYRDFDAPTFTMAMKVGGTYLAGRTDLPTAIAVARGRRPRP